LRSTATCSLLANGIPAVWIVLILRSTATCSLLANGIPAVWIALICDYAMLSSKEPNKISYEEWRALWMDISVAYSGLSSVVLRSSCCLGVIDIVCSAVA
jgi:hypothetical protein